MDNYALINVQTNLVENIVLWDGQSHWQSPDGYICLKIRDDEAEIGSTYNPDTKTFTPSPREVDSMPGTEPAVIG